MQKVLSTFLETCTSKQTKCVLGKFACWKGLLRLSEEVIINVFNALPNGRCAIMPLEDKQNRLFLKCDRGIFLSEETQKSFQHSIVDIYCSGGFCSRQEYVKSVHGKRMMKSLRKVFNAKRAAMFWTFRLRTKDRQACCLVVMVQIALSRRRLVSTKMKNHLLFRRNFFVNYNKPHPNLQQKRQRSIQFPFMA